MLQSAFVKLPTELILIVFQTLSLDHLLHLAKTCRRLNQIATATYMARTGYSNPDKFCVIKPSGTCSMDQLTALSINFPLTALKQFVCVMSDGFERHLEMFNRFETYYTFRPTILTITAKRITLLVSRLSAIGSIRILVDLKPDNPTLQASHFYEAVIELAKACILKSCSSFQISLYRPIGPHTWYRFHCTSGTTSIAERFRIFLQKYVTRNKVPIPRGADFKYSRKNLPYTYPNTIPNLPQTPFQSNLTMIDFIPDIFYVSPISTWTFELMKCSPIICLKLSLLGQKMSTDKLDKYIFPQIIQSVNNLKEIHFASSERDFFKIFVKHLPSFSCLQKMTFSYIRIFGSSQASPTHALCLENRRPICTSLVRMIGSSYQVAYLLQSSIYFPSLMFIDIHMDSSSHSQAYDLFSENLSTIFLRLSEMDDNLCITVCIDNHQQRPIVPSEDSATGLQDDWAKPFIMVSRLIVQLPSSHDIGMPEELEHIFAWLNLFQSVKVLTLIRHSPEEIAGENANLSEDGHGKQMLDIIKDNFPGVETISIIYLPLGANRCYYGWANSRGNTQMWKGVKIYGRPELQSFEDCACQDTYS